MPLNIIDRLKPKQIEKLNLISKMMVKGESSEKLEQGWRAFIEESKHDIQIEDINVLVQFVLQHSYKEMSDDLTFHSEKIKYFNAEKNQIRDHIKKIREDRDNYLKSLEGEINTLAEYSQLDLLKLQQSLEKQIRVMQMMSNILKTFHETAKAIIQNIR